MASRCLLVATLAALGCAGRPPHGAPPPAAQAVPAPAPSAPPADAFAADVAPVLARRCAPCHNPGGRMYATMPFDAPATVAAHPEGVLKRIKDPAEHAAIAAWLATNAPR